MITDTTFLDVGGSHAPKFLNCVFHLSLLYRQLELHFELLGADSELASYKILLPLKNVIRDTFTVNLATSDQPHHRLFVELDAAPQLWKRSDEIDEEDLKERLSWSEHEQWIRQCDIITEPSMSSAASKNTTILMKRTLPIGMTIPIEIMLTFQGRWKAYWLRFSASKRDNGDYVGDLLESLEHFNIKARKIPITVTEDHGDALGVELEAQMQDLPYRVCYSFDVCLSHGYLFVRCVSRS
jgi:hypothetical protein